MFRVLKLKFKGQKLFLFGYLFDTLVLIIPTRIMLYFFLNFC